MKALKQAAIIGAALWFGALIGAQLAHREHAERNLAYEQQINELEDENVELNYMLSER